MRSMAPLKSACNGGCVRLFFPTVTVSWMRKKKCQFWFHVDFNRYQDILISHNFWREIAQTLHKDQICSAQMSECLYSCTLSRRAGFGTPEVEYTSIQHSLKWEYKNAKSDKKSAFLVNKKMCNVCSISRKRITFILPEEFYHIIGLHLLHFSWLTLVRNIFLQIALLWFSQTFCLAAMWIAPCQCLQWVSSSVSFCGVAMITVS